MRTIYLGPIYPVKLKEPSSIRTWSDWPEDVVETLRRWNSGHLSFASSGVFKCTRCEQFCKPQVYGTCKLDGDWYCDDCMIALAREGYAPESPTPVPNTTLGGREVTVDLWRGGGVMHRRRT